MNHDLRIVAAIAAFLALGPAPSLAQTLPVSDPCSGVTCPAGNMCYQGSCFEDPAAAEAQDPCAGVTCPAGNMCYQGACFPDEASSAPGGPRIASRSPHVAVLRVPLHITGFPPPAEADDDAPIAEVQCFLLDAAGNTVGGTMEFLVPATAAGADYQQRLEFEAALHDGSTKGTSVAAYRCTMKKFVGFGLLCAEPFAGEGSVCEVSGPLVLP